MCVHVWGLLNHDPCGMWPRSLLEASVPGLYQGGWPVAGPLPAADHSSDCKSCWTGFVCVCVTCMYMLKGALSPGADVSASGRNVVSPVRAQGAVFLF